MTFGEEKERVKQCGIGIDERIKAVMFDEEAHKYWYNGKELHGVTGAIGKMLGKNFPDTDTVKIATIYGKDIHSEVEHYFNDGREELSTEGAKWVVDTMEHWGDNLLIDRVEGNRTIRRIFLVQPLYQLIMPIRKNGENGGYENRIPKYGRHIPSGVAGPVDNKGKKQLQQINEEKSHRHYPQNDKNGTQDTFSPVHGILQFGKEIGQSHSGREK